MDGKIVLFLISVILLSFLGIGIVTSYTNCQNDEGCMWCDDECVQKDSSLVCLSVPPTGYSCECINETCQTVSNINKTEILGILPHLESIKVAFTELKNVSLSIVDFYEDANDQTSATCWREVAGLFGDGITLVDNTKVEINIIGENPAPEEVEKVRNMIEDIRNSVDTIADKIILEC